MSKKYVAIIGLNPSEGARSPKLWNKVYREIRDFKGVKNYNIMGLEKDGNYSNESSKKKESGALKNKPY